MQMLCFLKYCFLAEERKILKKTGLSLCKTANVYYNRICIDVCRGKIMKSENFQKNRALLRRFLPYLRSEYKVLVLSIEVVLRRFILLIEAM